MKRSILQIGTTARLVVCFLTLVVTPLFAHAQIGESIEIPYPFTVASHQYPGGVYAFTESGAFLILRSKTGEQIRQLIISNLGGPNSFLQEGALVFDNADGKHVLSEAWLPGRGGVLVSIAPSEHKRDYLIFSELSSTSHHSGKAVFDMTCARCHGEKGRGNEQADRSMGVAIPHLNSPEVQNKSDMELREIIASGTKDMPPVEIQQTGFLHRIPSQDIDSVIAYLRTLK